MNINRICAFLATLGPIGYLMAPGSMGTLVTLPFAYMLCILAHNQFIYFGAVITLFFIATLIVHFSLPLFGRHHDPSQIIVDEVVGCLLTFWGIPFSSASMIIGFILFRFFDVSKLGIVKRAEHIHGAWGIMLDDIIAALISNVILRLIFGYAAHCSIR